MPRHYRWLERSPSRGRGRDHATLVHGHGVLSTVWHNRVQGHASVAYSWALCRSMDAIARVDGRLVPERYLGVPRSGAAVADRHGGMRVSGMWHEPRPVRHSGARGSSSFAQAPPCGLLQEALCG